MNTNWMNRLTERRAVKVIAGIANFDLENVLMVARAAQAGGADAIDVAARPEIVRAVREAVNMTVFASSIVPAELAQAVENGADVVEIGNFDALYEQGIFISAEDVLKITEETVQLVKGRALVSATIPGHLSADAQIALAQAFEALGVDMIQTEGATRSLAAEPTVKALSAEEKAGLSFTNTRKLAQATRLPLMTASGIGANNVAEAFRAGASAVGIGSAVNKLTGETEMTAAVHAVITAVADSQENAGAALVS